ncbi:FHA domain protein [compost metagenome]
MRKLLAILSISLLGSPLAGLASEAAKPAGGIVQVLAYDGDDLINQVSGVVLGTDGTVVTAAHIREKAPRLVVVDDAGRRFETRVRHAWTGDDLLALTLRGGDLPKARELSGVAPGEHAPLRIVGYWNPQLEPARKRRLFGPSRPGFQATPAAAPSSVPGLVAEVSETSPRVAAGVGRGAYGAAALNRCGQVLGIVRTAPGATIEALWAQHVPAPPLWLSAAPALAQKLKAIGVETRIAAAACEDAGKPDGAAPSTAEAEKRAAEAEKDKKRADEAESAKKRAEQAEKRARDKAGEARKRADEAEQRARDAEGKTQEAEREAESARREAAESVGGLGRQLDEQNRRLADTSQDFERWRLYAAFGGGALLLLSLALLVWRRVEAGRARSALAAATASFSDCLLQGSDSRGQPLGLTISGRDLARQPEGLVIGRNPPPPGVIVADETVSRSHVRLRLSGGELMLSDLESTGGTRLNGQDLVLGSEVPIRDGDVLELAGVRLVFQLRTRP